MNIFLSFLVILSSVATAQDSLDVKMAIGAHKWAISKGFVSGRWNGEFFNNNRGIIVFNKSSAEIQEVPEATINKFKFADNLMLAFNTYAVNNGFVAGFWTGIKSDKGYTVCLLKGPGVKIMSAPRGELDKTVPANLFNVLCNRWGISKGLTSGHYAGFSSSNAMQVVTYSKEAAEQKVATIQEIHAEADK